MAIVFAAPFLRVNAWRSTWPAGELRRRGHDAYVVGAPDPDAPEGLIRQTTSSYAAEDTIILHLTNQDWRGNQRQDRIGAEGLIAYLRGTCGARRVFTQLDDDYMALDDMQEVGPWWAKLKEDVVAGIRHSDGLICATPELAARYSKWAQRTWVIRNWIAEWVTRVSAPKIDPPVAGWFGLMAGHERDIAWAAPALKRLERVGVVGDPEGWERIVGVKPVYGKGIQLSMRRMYEMIARFSVGVAPVMDDAFNRSKSWIKPLEFAALGIPCIVSFVTPYRQLFDAGLPLGLHRDPEDMVNHVLSALWVRSLSKNPPHDEELRDTVRERFTIERSGGDEWEKFLADVGAA